ncbi:glycoside hydrolase family 2 protein [Promicromonospora sp. Marseille-Q5078]
MSPTPSPAPTATPSLPVTGTRTGTGTEPAGASRRELHQGWSVRLAGGPAPAGFAASLPSEGVPATVPGSVHTDLLAAGLIPDPYLDDHEALLAWIGRCDWEYRTTFAWEPDGHDRHDLVLDGLDTVADLRLNGTPVGATANMHRTYRFDVAAALVPGDNELVVRFSSPVRYADAQSLALGYRPQVNHHPFNAIRKMACSFGWDWGIDTATSGIWRPVRLESWSVARLAAVRPVVTVPAVPAVPSGAPAADGHVDVHVDLERAGSDGPVTVTATVAGHGARESATVTVPAGERSAVVPVDVRDARLWWPRGHGEHPLYGVEVTVAPEAGDGAADAWAGRVGFRSVRLDLVPDEHGTSFTIVVNDRPVWVRGANWIPDDAFPHRVTRERYAARLDQAEQAHMNLLRVWGGGLYEDDAFYDLCDERGVLVWQDFAFACAAYAEEEPLRAEVEAEARDNVTRLMPHPSLVLWNGSNENIWGHQTWGWIKRLEGKTWGLGYYTELLPSVVAELDPGRPYTPSSPWSGSLDVFPNDPEHGSMHSWELWNREDWPHYRDVVPRFMAEFGWQGPPTWSTLTRSVSDDPLTPESPGMRVHQKAMSGNDKLTDGLVAHVPLPDDMDDWHWAMSWNQATAVRVALEHLRSWSPRCMGAVMWQLNDCWPVTSWAAVDGDGHAKPLLHGIRRAFADRLVTVQPRSADGGEPAGDGTDGLAVVLVNDTDEPWAGDLELRRLGFDGAAAAATTVPVDVAPRGTLTVPVPADVAVPAAVDRELVAAAVGGQRATWFFAEPRDSALEAPALDTDVAATATGARVRVTASTLVRDLTLLADKVHPDAVVDTMLVDLLPGESVELEVTLPDGAVVDLAGLAAPGVLRSLNELAAAGRR